MFDGVPDAALRAVLAQRLDRVVSMMLEAGDGPRWAAVMLCRWFSLPARYERDRGRAANLGFVGVRRVRLKAVTRP